MEKLKLTTWTENSYVLTLLKVTDHFLNKNTKIPKKIVKYLFESSQKNCISKTYGKRETGFLTKIKHVVHVFHLILVPEFNSST